MAKALNAARRRNCRTRNKIRRVNIERAGVRRTRPRLSVFRSNRQIYAQVIDDIRGVTLAAASTLEKAVEAKNGADSQAAGEVGRLIAARAKKAGVDKVVFDRGRFLYHGRIKALAEGARGGGLEF